MNYPEARVQLVSVMGQYSEEGDFLIDEWLKKVRNASGLNQGKSSSIYLVEMARSRPFRIF